MQQLKLAEHIFDALSNNKQITIRQGHRDILLGDLEFESLELKRKCIVTVTSVRYCRFMNITDDEVTDDGFHSHVDMFMKLSKFYPTLTSDDEMTVIRFRGNECENT